MSASVCGRICSRFCTACGFSILATIRARQPRRSSSSRSSMRSEGRWTNDRPTYSTSCCAVHSRSRLSFSVRILKTQQHVKTLIPWRDRSWPARVTRRSAPAASAARRRPSPPTPVGEEDRNAGAQVVRQRADRASHFVGIVRGPVRDQPELSLAEPALDLISREWDPARTAGPARGPATRRSSAHSRPRPRGSRGGSRRARRACRARN